MGTFQVRTQELEESVGYGKLVGSVTVDQPYAQDQHETLIYKHQGGGKARYLSDPFFASNTRQMERLSDHVLDGGLERAMADNMEALSRAVFEEAPFEFGDLKASGHPEVTSDGVVTYDRPPNVGRLHPAEMEAKQHLRDLGFGHNSWENTEE